MPATKGRPGGPVPEDGADRSSAAPASATTPSVDEKRARGQETKAKAAAKQAEREERLARAEQKRATERSAVREEAENAVRRPVVEGSAEDVRRREADEKRVRKELGIVEPSPRWWVPISCALMILGLLWVVLFYISEATLPIKAIGNWNIGIGFALIIVGFAMLTRWR